MTLRVTSGKFRGKGIPSPPRSKPIRPTSALIRESVFNRFQAEIIDARFLDGFAGSGMMGLEALSRGAAFTLAVEQDSRQARQIRANFEEFGLSNREALALCSDITTLLAQACKEEPYDFIFLDPPYGFNKLPTLVSHCQTNQWLKPGGLLLVEHGRRDPDLPGFTRREYGDTSISCWVNEPRQDDENLLLASKP